MSGVNKAIILGNVGSDPEVKSVGENIVANFSLATSEEWTDKSGEKQKRVEWHRLNFWGKSAETIQKHVRKGDQLYVEGKIQTRTYEKDGQTHYATEIKGERFSFVGGKKKDEKLESLVKFDNGSEIEIAF